MQDSYRSGVAVIISLLLGCGYSQVNPHAAQEVGGVAHDGTRAVVGVLSGGGSAAKGALLNSAIDAPIGILIGAASVVTPSQRNAGPSRSEVSDKISDNEKHIQDNEAILRARREEVESSSRALSGGPR